MAIANTPNQTREWTLPSERELPAEQRTVFVLRGVPFAVRSQFGVLLGLAKNGADPDQLLGGIDPDELTRLYILAIRTSLTGWRNFRDAEGNEVPFKGTTTNINGVIVRGVASDETLDLINMQVLGELGAECLLSMVLSKRDVLG